MRELRAGMDHELPALLGVVVLAAVLRFTGLGDQSLWYDEAATAVEVRMSFGDMLGVLRDSEATPPLYYVLTWIWTRLVGEGEAALRSLSAIAGTAVVPLAWAAGRRVGPPGAGLAAALLVAVNPMLVWYSQEARAYALLALLSAASLLVFLVALERPTRRRLFVWAAVAAAALLTHHFAVFVVAAEAAVLLARAPRGPVLLACGMPAAVLAALVPLAIGQGSDDRTAWISDSPLAGRVEDVAVELTTANTALISSNSAAPGGLWWLLAAFGVALAAAPSAAAALRRRRMRASVVWAIAGAGVLVPLVAAATPLDFFKDRNLTAAWPLLLVCLGAGIALLPWRSLSIAAAVAVAVAGIAVCVDVKRTPELQRADWRGALRAVGPATTPRVFAVRPAYADEPLRAYGRSVIPLQPGTGIREIVVVGTELDSRAAAPAVGSFRLVRRWTRSGVSLLIYRSATLVRLDRDAIRSAGSPLYQPSEAAQRWLAVVSGAGPAFAAVATSSPPAVARKAALEAAEAVRRLPPAPPEVPQARMLTDRFRTLAGLAAEHARSPGAAGAERLRGALAELRG
jgi:4-amino-4-deoxy-L-arabinose transferase-like glycosyltransferase